MVVGMALGEDTGDISGAGAGNGLAPFVGLGETASMQIFDGDNDVGAGAEQDEPQGMATVAEIGVGRSRLWRCVGGSTEDEVCHCIVLWF